MAEEGEFFLPRLILTEGPEDVSFLSRLIESHDLERFHIRHTGTKRMDRGGHSRTVYDNTAGSGTVIAIINTLAGQESYAYDVAFAIGLTIVTTGTVAPDITVSYR